MSSLVEALAGRLATADVRLRARVGQLQQLSGHAWGLATDDGRTERFDEVILATGAHAASRLLKPVHPRLSEDLAAIQHASSTVVCMGYNRAQIRHPLDAFGCVVPRVERRRILAISFASQKFPGRAPDGAVLLRVFVGGALQPELADLPTGALRAMVQEELADLLGASGEPFFFHAARWPAAMPQYNLGHRQRVQRIQEQLGQLPGLHIAGNAWHGVGVPHCVHSGQSAAERIAARITR
jgi:oxygen-dependent protoporphyrinogen oxidase